MEKTKIKNYKIWFYIFISVGLLGLIDVATRSIAQQTYHLTDTGYVSIGILFLCKFLFGAEVASIFSVLFSTIFGFSIGWLVLAYFINQKEKFTEKPNEENLKKLKQAKIITLIVGSIFLALILFGMFLGIYDNLDRKGQDSFNLENQQWGNITSTDGHFSVNLPKNPVFYPSTPDQIEGYSYFASDQGGNVSYVVKYENYQASVKKTGVKLANASETVK